MAAARRTPLIAAVPKMLFPALVILPGMIAIAMHHAGGGKFLPLSPDGTPNYNMTIPAMLARYFPTGLLGVGFTALMASFMSVIAGKVNAFNTVWTYDIYQSYIAKDKSEHHYLWMGRWATVFGILASVGAAFLASKFNNIMDMLQLVFGFVNAPLFATFLLGDVLETARPATARSLAFLAGNGGCGALSRAGVDGNGASPGSRAELDQAQKFIFHSEMVPKLLDGHLWRGPHLRGYMRHLTRSRAARKTDAEAAGLVYRPAYAGN